MEKLQLIRDRLDEVLVKRLVYNFPKLLKELRGAFGATRISVCRDLSFDYMRMFALENGTFGSYIREREIRIIAEYYGIDKNFLMEKATCFVVERKGNS